jgi:hypothetical protein
VDYNKLFCPANETKRGSLGFAVEEPIFWGEDLVNNAAGDYVEPLVAWSLSSVAVSPPVVTDRVTGQEIHWQTGPFTAILQKDPEKRYLIVEKQGQRILAVRVAWKTDGAPNLEALGAVLQILKDQQAAISQALVLIGTPDGKLADAVQKSIHETASHELNGIFISIKAIKNYAVDLEQEMLRGIKVRAEKIDLASLPAVTTPTP